MIVAVVAYNKWQEGRLSKRAERDFGSRHDDVLVSRAPTASDVAEASSRGAAAAAITAPSGERIEHNIGGMDAGRIDAGGMDAPPVPASDLPVSLAGPVYDALDPQVDCIVTLECPGPVDGVDAIAAGRGLLDPGLGRTIRWEAAGEQAETWGPLLADRRYTYLRAGMQLVDRSGPATEEEVGAFFEGMQEMALALAAETDFPDADETLAAAQALDAFCADVDVQIGLNVIATAGQPFSGTKLRALAEAGGLRLGEDGAFHRFDDHGRELFTLSNGEPGAFGGDSMRTLATPAVAVTLDVPRAPGSVSTFRLYLDFARQLEQALGGMLVDDNKRPVGQAALETIGRQLERIYAAMDARGVPAGSPAALRLFA